MFTNWGAWLTLFCLVMASCAPFREQSEKRQFKAELREVSREVDRGKRETMPSLGEIPERRGHTELALIEKAMGQYETVLSKHQLTNKERREAQRRYSDLAVEHERLRILLVLEQQAEAVKRGESASPPLADYRKPIALYHELLRDPEATEKELIYYQLAFCHEQMGNIRESAQALQTLIEEYPQN